MILGVGAFDHPVVHTAGTGNLLGVAGFGLHHGVVHHVVALDFHDQVAPVVFLHQKVRVVAAHGMGVGVDVLDEKFALAVGEHSGKENLLNALIP